MRHWLMKSEPDAYSFAHLESEPSGEGSWDGVRNYQARNFMKDMDVGDLVLFYHSRTKPPHVVGVAEITHTAIPDPTCWDPDSKYFDPKSSADSPRWFMVKLRAVERLPSVVTLDAMKENPLLEGMLVTKRGQRLSVQPVEPHHFEEVLRMAQDGAD